MDRQPLLARLVQLDVFNPIPPGFRELFRQRYLGGRRSDSRLGFASQTVGCAHGRRVTH